jgi:hypothetical protein
MDLRISNRPSQMAALLVPALVGSAASAQDDTQELAKKLSNPIASMISVPFQFNYDSGYGRTTVIRPTSMCNRSSRSRSMMTGT